jgi:hypothetical protein
LGIEEGFFVAKSAPQNDGQKRLVDSEVRLGEEDQSRFSGKYAQLPIARREGKVKVEASI